jgi:glyoxylase-like metal-dependent hydrolase (beta-lactamase superfamily II)
MRAKLWTWTCAAALVLATAAGAARAQQGFGDPNLPEGQTRQVAAHTWVIMGFPNIGIVVGDDFTLVVDTGLGTPNGALIAREAKKLSRRDQQLILTTTHFHPEHASGQAGFPFGTRVIRDQAQQDELDRDGQAMIDLFASRSASMGSLLNGAVAGKADTLFDREADLDLGNLHVKLLHFGAAHTLGDEIVYVVEDSLILPGDVVQNRISPNIICGACSPRQWIAVLDEVAKLKPQQVVPDHGALGGGALIGQERGFLAALDQRALDLKGQGVPAPEAGKRIQAEFEKTYAGWQGLGNLPQSVQRAYADPRP